MFQSDHHARMRAALQALDTKRDMEYEAMRIMVLRAHRVAQHIHTVKLKTFGDTIVLSEDYTEYGERRGRLVTL